MSDARESILNRLRDSTQPPPVSLPSGPTTEHAPLEERIQQFTRLLESVRGQVYRVTADTWVPRLHQILAEHQIKQLLVAPSVPPGKDIVAQPPQGITLRHYDAEIGQWKSALFNEIDATVTGAVGGIAETGTLILWPSPDEPRLMSLVPPLHIVVMDSAQLYGTFAEVMSDQDWARRMPTNALLISGPSKSADIEQVLAYGVHGPKDLIVLLRE